MEGVRNALADERLFLPTMDTTIDFLRIAHGRIMTVKNEPYYPIFIEKPGLFLFCGYFMPDERQL
jgi:hypothetical protein